MSQILDWFEEEISFAESVTLVYNALFFEMAWITVVAGITSVMSIYPDDVMRIVVMAPIIEETIFRFIPLGLLVVLYATGSRISGNLIIFTVVFIGLLFGIAHLGNQGVTVVSSLLVQGVFGITLGIVFLKVSAMRVRRIFPALMASILLHAAWNGIIVVVSFM
jgi:hypothetical protein